jgi:hypothetical protein
MTESVEAGDVASTVILSPCVGGLIRTWTESGSTQLWSVPSAGFVLANQGTGVLGRTSRQEGSFQESGMLVADRQTLMLRERFPTEQDADGTMRIPGYMVNLEPAREPLESTFDDFVQLLTQAMGHSQAASEALVVELGGWDVKPGPYCLFVETEEQGVRINSFQTAPAPVGSVPWSSPAVVVGEAGSSLRLPAGSETLEQGPWVMMDAIYRWGLAPWDLTLSFAPIGRVGTG